METFLSGGEQLFLPGAEDVDDDGDDDDVSPSPDDDSDDDNEDWASREFSLKGKRLRLEGRARASDRKRQR